MSLAHRLLYLLRVGVDYNLCAFAKTEEQPSALKDVRDGQEVHYAVFIRYRHNLVVSLKRGMKLTVRKHHALAVAGGSAGVEYVAEVVFIGLGIQLFHFRLPRTVLAERQEIVKIY